MVSKLWVVSAALFTLLAGCADDVPGTDPADAEDPSDAGDGNQTVAPTNAAPTASLEASATNGTAPLNATFTLGGSDPDGDNLTWSLTVGNDTQTGDVLPATVNHTFGAGNHTITLTVSDGNTTGNASIVIAVEAAGVVEEIDDGICHRNAVVVGGEIYVLDEGGTWIFAETNGIPGLQVGNTHITGPDGGGQGFANPAWADCVDGDMMLV